MQWEESGAPSGSVKNLERIKKGREAQLKKLLDETKKDNVLIFEKLGVDYLFVDMPPGTGDVALNVFQTLPVDGVIIVTSPQDLVGMVVEKAVKMAQMLNIPIVGLVENMSYLACPDCGRKIYLFGEGKTQEAADRYGLPLLAQMPIDPALAALVDAGRIEDFQGSWLSAAADRLEC